MRKSDASWNYLTLRTARFPETPPPHSLIASESASGASSAQHPAVSPSAMSPPPASPRRSPSPPETPEPASCLYCTPGGWWRGGGRWVSRVGWGVYLSHTPVSEPIPPCHSSLPPFTGARGNTPLGAPLYQFPAGLQEPCKRQSGTMCF